MAKKSAKSKGYRKSTGKKPYLSKRDIIMLCVILAVVAVGAILLFSYDDGALKVKDGKIVDAGENWVIVNGAARGTRYYKLAEVDDIAGYEKVREPMPTDENMSMFKFTPEDEASDVQSIVVAGSAVNSARQADYYRALMTEFTPSELTTTKAGDLEYSYFTYTHAYYEEPEEGAADEGAAPAEETKETAEPAEDATAEAAAEPTEETAEAAAETAEETAEATAETAEETTEAAAEDAEASEPAEEDAEVQPNRFQKAINAFADGGRGSISITAVCESDTEEALASDEDLVEIAVQALSAIHFEPAK